MATFQSLINSECGQVNPLIQLSQLYTRDTTNVLQDGILPQTTTTVHSHDGRAEQFLQEYHQPLIAPNTFHLDGLLAGLHVNDQMTPSRYDNQWTNEFLQPTTTTIQNFRPLPKTFIPYQPMLYPDHTMPTFHPPPPSQAAQEILKYIQETETTPKVVSESKSVEMDGTATLAWLNNRLISPTSWSQSAINSSDFYSEYKFASNNPFLEHSKPFEEGLQRLAVHDIVNAALFFEAAVKQNSDHIDAWLYLGITQSENEQDCLAICALKKCVELDSKNLRAYLTIASCYANESLIDNAMHALQQWLLNNDQYSHLVKNNNRLSSTFNSDYDIDFLNETLFDDLQQALLQAITSSPNQIDADLQTCLGILFHLASDYDKAAECFQTAVLAKPDDPRLWNKLGAALANGGQSEKAVEAYYHALNLSPGFVRARYNLGISCFNLNANQPAIEHFLTALKQQNDGMGPHGSQAQMSENIWRTLGLTIARIQRKDLSQYVIQKDLTKLLKEFQLE